MEDGRINLDLLRVAGRWCCDRKLWRLTTQQLCLFLCNMSLYVYLERCWCFSPHFHYGMLGDHRTEKRSEKVVHRVIDFTCLSLVSFWLDSSSALCHSRSALHIERTSEWRHPHTRNLLSFDVQAHRGLSLNVFDKNLKTCAQGRAFWARNATCSGAF